MMHMGLRYKNIQYTFQFLSLVPFDFIIQKVLLRYHLDQTSLLVTISGVHLVKVYINVYRCTL